MVQSSYHTMRLTTLTPTLAAPSFTASANGICDRGLIGNGGFKSLVACAKAGTLFDCSKGKYPFHHPGAVFSSCQNKPPLNPQSHLNYNTGTTVTIGNKGVTPRL